MKASTSKASKASKTTGEKTILTPKLNIQKLSSIRIKKLRYDIENHIPNNPLTIDITETETNTTIDVLDGLTNVATITLCISNCPEDYTRPTRSAKRSDKDIPSLKVNWIESKIKGLGNKLLQLGLLVMFQKYSDIGFIVLDNDSDWSSRLINIYSKNGFTNVHSGGLDFEPELDKLIEKKRLKLENDTPLDSGPISEEIKGFMATSYASQSQSQVSEFCSQDCSDEDCSDEESDEDDEPEKCKSVILNGPEMIGLFQQIIHDMITNSRGISTKKKGIGRIRREKLTQKKKMMKKRRMKMRKTKKINPLY